MSADEQGSDGELGEQIELEAPLYYVKIPRNMPNLVFPEDEYGLAFESATGVSVGDVDGHEDESKISVVDFEGTTEVPIANAY